MQSLSFVVDENLKETTNHGDGDFPVAVYLHNYNLNKEGNVILHWHEEIQFVIQHSAGSLYTVSDRNYLLSEGDVLFINSSCLHKAKPLDRGRSSYICIDIHPRFLFGSGSSYFRQAFLLPLLSSGITAIHIDGSENWHSQVKKDLRTFLEVFERQDFAYEMEAHSLVCGIWLQLVRNNKTQIEDRRTMTAPEEEKLGRMMEHIHGNYAGRITLSSIATAGGMSKSECCRFFSRLLGITPVTYLNNYRLVMSTRLLTSTDKSIDEIASLSGFSSSSYYTEKFRKLMNLTPSDYRKRFPMLYKGHKLL